MPTSLSHRKKAHLDGVVFAFALMILTFATEGEIMASITRLGWTRADVRASLARLVRRGLLERGAFRYELPSGAGTGWLYELSDLPEYIATRPLERATYRAILQERFGARGRSRRRARPTWHDRVLRGGEAGGVE